MAEVTKNSKVKIVTITPNTQTDTGIKTTGLYKLQIGSLEYTVPLYFIFTDSGPFATKLNSTWYSNSMSFEYKDGSLYITYSTSNSVTLYFTLLE